MTILFVSLCVSKPFYELDFYPLVFLNGDGSMSSHRQFLRYSSGNTPWGLYTSYFFVVKALKLSNGNRLCQSVEV